MLTDTGRKSKAIKNFKKQFTISYGNSRNPVIFMVKSDHHESTSLSTPDDFQPGHPIGRTGYGPRCAVLHRPQPDQLRRTQDGQWTGQRR